RRCDGVHYRDFKILCKRFFAKNLKKMTAWRTFLRYAEINDYRRLIFHKNTPVALLCHLILIIFTQNLINLTFI
ncbi:hypothetical protein EIM44_01340, partial [Bibersteinia trehalosi]